MKVKEEEIGLLPTEEDVAFYREHGWYISKKIIPDEVIDEALRGCERYYAGERDWHMPDDLERIDWKPEMGNVLRHNSYLSLQNKEIRNLVRSPLIGAVAARLIGTRAIRLFRDTLIYKPPAEGSTQTYVGWHTDRAYWLMCSSDQMISAFVPLHDCDERTGTVMMLDGSHRWPGTLEMRHYHVQDLQTFLDIVDTGGNPIVQVPMRLKKGQVSYHHCRTIHGSYDNFTDRPRVVMTVHMQDEANQFQECYDADGKLWSHANDPLCRKLESGFPDYTDPHICPLLWEDDA